MIKIKELRKNKNLTQKELAKLVGVSSQSILNWENGLCEPPIEHIISLAKIFNVSCDYLLGNNTSKEDLVNILKNYLSNLTKEELIKYIEEFILELIEK